MNIQRLSSESNIIQIRICEQDYNVVGIIMVYCSFKE